MQKYSYEIEVNLYHKHYSFLELLLSQLIIVLNQLDNLFPQRLLLLLIHCLLLLSFVCVCGGWYILVVQYLISFLVLQSSR